MTPCLRALGIASRHGLAQLMPKRGTWHWQHRGFRAGLWIALGAFEAAWFVMRGQHLRPKRVPRYLRAGRP